MLKADIDGKTVKLLEFSGEPHFKDNPLLDELYYLLIDLGYRISDEEQQMRHGTHPLFMSEDS